LEILGCPRVRLSRQPVAHLALPVGSVQHPHGERTRRSNSRFPPFMPLAGLATKGALRHTTSLPAQSSQVLDVRGRNRWKSSRLLVSLRHVLAATPKAQAPNRLVRAVKSYALFGRPRRPRAGLAAVGDSRAFGAGVAAAFVIAGG